MGNAIAYDFQLASSSFRFASSDFLLYSELFTNVVRSNTNGRGNPLYENDLSYYRIHIYRCEYFIMVSTIAYNSLIMVHVSGHLVSRQLVPWYELSRADETARKTRKDNSYHSSDFYLIIVNQLPQNISCLSNLSYSP